MELTFCPADPMDIDTIFTLSRDLIARYEDIQNIDYEKVLNWVHRKIENHISEYTCIFAEGKKAGFYRLSPSDGVMELDDLYILPEYRNQGIGTAVIQKCCAETNLPVMLYVFTRNTGAFSLYKRLGFRIAKNIGKSRCILVRNPEEIL